MTHALPGSSSERWKHARRSAFVQDALGTLTQRPGGLLSFEQVSQKLKLGSVRYMDAQEVPLERIVGSVGRYADFTRAFLPRTEHLQERWQNVERLMASGRPLPPVDLYQVGQVYFVSDGNHRVSVARQMGWTTIRARVWEYETPVVLEPGVDVDELLCRTARAAFLERTHLDRLRPEVELRLTEPNGYDDLLVEIETYRRILSDLDEQELSSEEGVILWCDIRYQPLVQIMRERQVLREFPGRTETDLYLWLCRNHRDLQAHYEGRVLMGAAADDLVKRYGESLFPVHRLTAPLRQATAVTAARATAWLRGRAKSRGGVEPPPSSDQDDRE